MDKKKEIKTSIGGQALIEGIMMRGPKKTSMAVRKTDGSIYIETTDTKISKSKLKKIPMIRGTFAFIESMISGYKALMRSAEISMPTQEELDEMEKEEKAKKAAKKNKKKAEVPEAPAAPEALVAPEVPEEPAEPVASVEPEKAEEPAENADSTEKKQEQTKDGTKLISDGGMTLIMILGVVLGLGLSIFLFKFIPETVYEWTIERAVGDNKGYGWNLLRSAVTGVMKLAILVGYMAVVSCMKDIRRTFMYHGAEHKTIFCYERGEELTVENVRRQTRFHPRCGTSFIVLSVLVSIFFTMFIPSHLVESSKILNTLARTGISLLMLPIIMGAGYELIRFAGKHENKCTKILSAPGVWLQHITTKEPDDSMIECAIAAVKEVIPDDGSDQIK